MNDSLTKALAQCRADWEATIAELGPDGLERPGATGDWRVRDVLAHFNGWDRWQIVQLRAAFTGEQPTKAQLEGGLNFPEHAEYPGEDGMNAMFHAANKDRPLEDVVADWREISDMWEAWARNATPEMLDAIIGADWAESSPGRVMRLASEVPDVQNPQPASEFAAQHVDHQREHLEIVRTWMRG